MHFSVWFACKQQTGRMSTETGENPRFAESCSQGFSGRKGKILELVVDLIYSVWYMIYSECYIVHFTYRGSIFVAAKSALGNQTDGDGLP